MRQPFTYRGKVGGKSIGNTVCVLRTVLPFAFLVSGCYRYVPVEIATVSPREEVSIRVTDDAARRLTKEFGAYSPVFRGHFAEQGKDSVSVSVLVGREYNGIVLESAPQIMFLGRSEVVNVSRRRLARGKSALLTAGAIVAFGLVVNTVVQRTDENDPGEGPTPPPPPSARFPILLRIPIR